MAKSSSTSTQEGSLDKKKDRKKLKTEQKAKYEELDKSKKRKHEGKQESTHSDHTVDNLQHVSISDKQLLGNDPNSKGRSGLVKPITVPHRYILAPMVGASELAFRLLCRKYGAELAYTPMMSAQKFATDKTYREEEFQTCANDRPLVCHFAANTPEEFAAAARVAEPYCDAIDLNLGCPQRTAYLGHFGSYLLEDKDRQLVCSIVKAGAKAVQIPIFCKIRLLDRLEDTIRLCEELRDAGASLIAVHGRFRASWDRKGPGARDGPALMDQICELKKAITDIPIIANGNTITYENVQDNLKDTGADGLMSAEGILDNPALFFPRLTSTKDDVESDPRPTHMQKKQKLEKKLRKIVRIEKLVAEKGTESIDKEDKRRLEKKVELKKALKQLDTSLQNKSSKELHTLPEKKLVLAEEYIDLATKYPVKMRSVIFHIRRIMKSMLDQYQLMEECLASDSLQDIRSVLAKIKHYQEKPEAFVFDKEQAKQEKEASEKKQREEGKRKAYEARMMRKAKREGKKDLTYYLHIGAEVPAKETVLSLKAIPRPEALAVWKSKHSQHCISFHLDTGGCARQRTCAFLHVDVLGSNTFDEKDEVAG